MKKSQLKEFIRRSLKEAINPIIIWERLKELFNVVFQDDGEEMFKKYLKERVRGNKDGDPYFVVLKYLDKYYPNKITEPPSKTMARVLPDLSKKIGVRKVKEQQPERQQPEREQPITIPKPDVEPDRKKRRPLKPPKHAPKVPPKNLYNEEEKTRAMVKKIVQRYKKIK